MLNQNSSVPLYKQLKNDLMEQIGMGSLAAGERLPTEHELCEKYNVSRITVRAALGELVEEGTLTRQQGKGTFVTMSKIHEKVMENRSFTSLILENGGVPGAKTITIALQEASPTDVEQLHVAPDAKVLYLQRVRSVDARPIMLENVYFPEKYAELIRHDLDNLSVYELLKEHFGVTAFIPKKTIEMTYATEQEKKLLKIKKNDPVILVREVVHDADGVPVHRTKQLLAGDQFRFEII